VSADYGKQGTIQMRIIVADGDQRTLWALRTLLDEEPEMEVVGEAANVEELRMLVEDRGADLMLLDSRLPGSEMKALISELHARKPRPFVVVMSSDFENSRPMLHAGADAFVSKGEKAGWLLETLQRYLGRTTSVNKY
jgi:DNA-binding NarL/FixJ family response regulator